MIDGPKIRARLGVVPQEDSLDTELTVFDNLVIYGRYFDLPRPVIRERAEELLAFMQLSDRRDDRVDPLSGGMKRRLTIARALVNQPDLLLLDEPTTGLDPQARHLLWERFYQLKRQGVTTVLTTHYMEEAEQLCDRLVIMDGGHIVAEGSPRELVARYSTREVVELRFFDGDARDKVLPRHHGARAPGGGAPRPCARLHRRRRRDLRAGRERRRRSGLDVRAARHARGRLPDPHRPDARGLTWRPRRVVRVVEREWVVWRRLWRGSVFSYVFAPLLFLAAMGIGLGDLVDKHQGSGPGLRLPRVHHARASWPRAR